jgi:hypothetical protein
MANEKKLHKRTDRRRASDIQVFAMRILTFSSRFSEFTAIVLSRMKPEKKIMEKGDLQRKKDTNLRQDMNLSIFHRLF